MSDVITFYPTNNVEDPGFVATADEVASRFWASDEAEAWLANSSGQLERLALNWVPQNVGQWERLREDWELIYDAILAAMPRNS
jgi:hypothetical protein